MSDLFFFFLFILLAIKYSAKVIEQNHDYIQINVFNSQHLL